MISVGDDSKKYLIRNWRDRILKHSRLGDSLEFGRHMYIELPEMSTNGVVAVTGTVLRLAIPIAEQTVTVTVGNTKHVMTTNAVCDLTNFIKNKAHKLILLGVSMLLVPSGPAIGKVDYCHDMSNPGYIMDIIVSTDDLLINLSNVR